jgi:hypothetical protein
MRILLVTAVLFSASAAYANEPIKLAQAAEPPKATETKPTETKATETKPADTKATETAKKKPVAKKRAETDEEKARRIGRKYGVTW